MEKSIENSSRRRFLAGLMALAVAPQILTSTPLPAPAPELAPTFVVLDEFGYYS
jgi:hypothetical protein